MLIAVHYLSLSSTDQFYIPGQPPKSKTQVYQLIKTNTSCEQDCLVQSEEMGKGWGRLNLHPQPFSLEKLQGGSPVVLLAAGRGGKEGRAGLAAAGTGPAELPG